jgi:hypothetical protein
MKSRPKEFLKLLHEKEAIRFGDRIPPGYTKVDILGKGAKAIVWRAAKGGANFAVKQFPKTDGAVDKSVDTEIRFS